MAPARQVQVQSCRNLLQPVVLPVKQLLESQGGRGKGGRAALGVREREEEHEPNEETGMWRGEDAEWISY